MTAVDDDPAAVPAIDSGGNTGGTTASIASRTHVARWVALGVGVVMLALVAVFATREPARNTSAASPLIGEIAPEIIATDIDDGKTVRAAAFRGRYVVVNFFASWCVPCRNEHPELERFTARHVQKGDAQVLAVVFNDDVDDARKWFAENGGDWPVVEDPRGKIALDFGVRLPPESFVIDPDGVVLTRIVGEVDADGLDRVIAQAEQMRARR